MANADDEDDYDSTVRFLEIKRNVSESCGFHLTRSKWDPYPWVSEVDSGSTAEVAGVKAGDCVLEVNGEDIIGQRIAKVASLVKTSPEKVSLLLWSTAEDTKCNPETLCCGPMPSNLQRLSACMSSILAVLECPICMDTIPPPAHQCENGHLICVRCRVKTERCPVCRVRFSRGRSLLADQVYNSLTDVFELRRSTTDNKKLQICEKIVTRSQTPCIKVDGINNRPTHANKFLARLMGKSTSEENLSTSCAGVLSAMPRHLDDEFTSLKAKSLSSNEIFQPFASPALSRTNSVSNTAQRIRTEKTQRTQSNFLEVLPVGFRSSKRPISCHGSYESLNDDAKHSHLLLNPLTKIQTNTMLYRCPYSRECPDDIRGNRLMKHLQSAHTGPIVYYYKPEVRLPLALCATHDGLNVIIYDNNLFFLKTHLRDCFQCERNWSESDDHDGTVWLWLLGNENDANKYRLEIDFCSSANEKPIGYNLSSAVYPLNTTSWDEIDRSQKGIHFTFNALKSHIDESCYECILMNISIKYVA